MAVKRNSNVFYNRILKKKARKYANKKIYMVKRKLVDLKEQNLYKNQSTNLLEARSRAYLAHSKIIWDILNYCFMLLKVESLAFLLP